MAEQEPQNGQEVAAALEQRLRAVAAGRLAIGECAAWARRLPAGLDRTLQQSTDGRLAVASDALAVLRHHGDGDPELERASAAGWLRLMLGPRPPAGPGRPLATFAEPPVAFARRTGADLVRFVVEGLGVCRAVLLADAAREHWFSCWWGEAGPTPGEVTLEVRPTEAPTRAAAALFETLAVDEHDVRWLAPGVDVAALPEWTLLRTDDNGNCIAVLTTHSRAKAEARGAALAASGHRQLYEVVAGRR